MRVRAVSIVLVALVILSMFLVAGSTLADESATVEPSSIGIVESPDGVQVTWIDDGKNYGIALGKELRRDKNLAISGLGIFQPEDDRQLALGFSLGYDIKLGEMLTITPLVGGLTDITSGYDGRQTRGFYGLKVKVAISDLF